MTALDRAIIAHREHPTPETRAALMAAQERHAAAFRQRMATAYRTRVTGRYEAACAEAARLYAAGEDTTAIDAECDQLQQMLDKA